MAQTRAAKGFAILTVIFFAFIIPIERFAARETTLVLRYPTYPKRISSRSCSTLVPQFKEYQHENNFGEEVLFNTDNMRTWSRVMACCESSGPMVFLGQPHPV